MLPSSLSVYVNIVGYKVLAHSFVDLEDSAASLVLEPMQASKLTEC